jgi:hypothetical protein
VNVSQGKIGWRTRVVQLIQYAKLRKAPNRSGHGTAKTNVERNIQIDELAELADAVAERALNVDT